MQKNKCILYLKSVRSALPLCCLLCSISAGPGAAVPWPCCCHSWLMTGTQHHPVCVLRGGSLSPACNCQLLINIFALGCHGQIWHRKLSGCLLPKPPWFVCLEWGRGAGAKPCPRRGNDGERYRVPWLLILHLILICRVRWLRSHIFLPKKDDIRT